MQTTTIYTEQEQLSFMRTLLDNIVEELSMPGRALMDTESAALGLLMVLQLAQETNALPELYAIVRPWAAETTRKVLDAVEVPCRIQDVAEPNDLELMLRVGDMSGVEL